MSAPEGFVPDPVTPSTASAPAAPAKKPDLIGQAKAFLTAPPPAGSQREGGLGPYVRGAGELLLPGSFPELAFMAGTALATPAKLIPYISKLPLPVLRVILGATSEGAATAAQGEGFEAGFQQGGIAGTIGEGIGLGGTVAKKVVGKTVGRGLEAVGLRPGAKERAAAEAEKAAAPMKAWQAAEDAKAQLYRDAVASYRTEQSKYKADLAKVRTGQKALDTTLDKATVANRSERMAEGIGQFAERVPPFSGIRGADQLEALARERQKSLGTYFQNRVQEASNVIGPETTIRVPALNVKKDDMVITQYGPMPAALLGLESEGERMTLTEASKKLAALRLLAYGGSKNDPTARTIAGSDSRQKYGQALSEIEKELASFPNGEQAVAAWTDGRKAMAVGSTLIDLLQKKGLFTRTSEGQALDTRRLQSIVSENRGWLRERMGADDYKALLDVVYPKGRIGSADVLKSSPPQLVGEVPPARIRLAEPQAPTAPTKPTPAPKPTAPPPTTLDHPVNLPQIMIDAAVNNQIGSLKPMPTP